MASGGRLLGAAGKAGTGDWGRFGENPQSKHRLALRRNIKVHFSEGDLSQSASEWSVPGGKIESQKLLCSTFLIHL